MGSKISKILSPCFIDVPYRLLTLVFGTTLLKPRCMHEADSSGCPPKVPGSTISFLEFTPTRLKGDFTNQNMLDSLCSNSYYL